MSAFGTHRKCTIDKNVNIYENEIPQGQGHQHFFLKFKVCRVIDPLRKSFN